jgi:hypothetical protein
MLLIPVSPPARAGGSETDAALRLYRDAFGICLILQTRSNPGFKDRCSVEEGESAAAEQWEKFCWERIERKFGSAKLPPAARSSCLCYNSLDLQAVRAVLARLFGQRPADHSEPLAGCIRVGFSPSVFPTRISNRSSSRIAEVMASSNSRMALARLAFALV